MVEKVHNVSVSECWKEERTRETREEGAEGWKILDCLHVDSDQRNEALL